MAIVLSNLLARVKHYRKDLHSGEHLYALQTAARILGSQALLTSTDVSLTTVVGQNIYDVTLPAPVVEGMDESAVRIAAVHDVNGDSLRESNAKEMGKYRRGNLLDVGTPIRWMDNMGKLVLDPAPDAIALYTVSVFTCPALTAEIVDMPMQAEAAIVAGAIHELMLIPGEGFNPTLASVWAMRWTKEFGNYMGLVTLGSSGTGTMHIVSQYTARSRAGGGPIGWMTS